MGAAEDMTDYPLTDEELAYIRRGHMAARAIILGTIFGGAAGVVAYMLGWWG